MLRLERKREKEKSETRGRNIFRTAITFLKQAWSNDTRAAKLRPLSVVSLVFASRKSEIQSASLSHSTAWLAFVSWPPLLRTLITTRYEHPWSTGLPRWG